MTLEKETNVHQKQAKHHLKQEEVKVFLILLIQGILVENLEPFSFFKMLMSLFLVTQPSFSGLEHNLVNRFDLVKWVVCVWEPHFGLNFSGGSGKNTGAQTLVGRTWVGTALMQNAA